MARTGGAVGGAGAWRVAGADIVSETLAMTGIGRTAEGALCVAGVEAVPPVRGIGVRCVRIDQSVPAIGAHFDVVPTEIHRGGELGLRILDHSAGSVRCLGKPVRAFRILDQHVASVGVRREIIAGAQIEIRRALREAVAAQAVQEGRRLPRVVLFGCAVEASQILEPGGGAGIPGAGRLGGVCEVLGSRKAVGEARQLVGVLQAGDAAERAEQSGGGFARRRGWRRRGRGGRSASTSAARGEIPDPAQHLHHRAEPRLDRHMQSAREDRDPGHVRPGAVLALEQGAVALHEHTVGRRGADLFLHLDQTGQPYVHGRRRPGSAADHQVIAHPCRDDHRTGLRVRHGAAEQRVLRTAGNRQTTVHGRLQM